jgi:photosystem II stability/assembly factor-like uncharacterized protein
MEVPPLGEGVFQGGNAVAADSIGDVAVVQDWQIQVSADSGRTWKVTFTPPLMMLNSDTLTNLGPHGFAVIADQRVWVSLDGGKTWNPRTPA